MNERYLFRGKRIEDGKWVTGYYALDNDIPTIIMAKGSYWRVDPDTIGQCTGLMDENGVLIFEWDIVKVRWNGQVEIGSVEYDGGIYWVVPDGRGTARTLIDCLGRIEIIGNIHDTPELVGG